MTFPQDFIVTGKIEKSSQHQNIFNLKHHVPIPKYAAVRQKISIAMVGHNSRGSKYFDVME